jgi:hypothetical protein
MHRKLFPLVVLAAVATVVFTVGCGTLRTVRIRKDVTLKTFREPDFKIKPHSTIAVIPPVKKDETLGGISLSTHEAAQDMMSLKLWQDGYRVIDKVFVKELLEQEKIAFENFSVEQAVHVGKELHADYVMLASLNDFEEDVRSVDFGPFNVINTVDTSVLVGLNCRLVDVASQKVVWSGVATTQDKNLQLSLSRISDYLIATLRNGAKQPKEREIPGLGLHY